MFGMGFITDMMARWRHVRFTANSGHSCSSDAEDGIDFTRQQA
jgi:hypothetical protein